MSDPKREMVRASRAHLVCATLDGTYWKALLLVSSAFQTFAEELLTPMEFYDFQSATSNPLGPCLSCDIFKTKKDNHHMLSYEKYADDYLICAFLKQKIACTTLEITIMNMMANRNGVWFVITHSTTTPHHEVVDFATFLLDTELHVSKLVISPLSDKYVFLYDVVFWPWAKYEHDVFASKLQDKIKMLDSNGGAMSRKDDILTYFSSGRFSGLVDTDELQHIFKTL